MPKKPTSEKMQLFSSSIESIEVDTTPKMMMMNAITSFLWEFANKAMSSFVIDLTTKSLSTISLFYEAESYEEEENIPFQLMADT